ncbi:acylneuraminate cytidylyltransferase family protein [Candidatus Viadribacter manganicus]|uniref:Acylneuraminate cytidylyltransferase n=1 Tax=Candidatus Viadribacter manganicus TaxID=1759059 RepID=A0A1B1AJY5_9PROT|nr:acylneuraminate cytidylyltransferase family protein [Candidatus Viadribacter manganicus]ANP46830.1 acylneuraminate cytidylyltransferase [Candidatus Viadribacter manganicus]
MTGAVTAVALIPARAGSKRIPDKNIGSLHGHPLIAYTICAARQAGVFDAVVVSTDSERYAAIAQHYGADVPGLRPITMSGDISPDIEWVRYTLQMLTDRGEPHDIFSLLRPTSPCRKPQTIQRAMAQFAAQVGVDSLRAVEKCEQHPGKMWIVSGDRMQPLLPMADGQVPFHSSQYAALPEVYVQNASLEIAWSRVALEHGSIAGEILTPFLTQGDEGFDVNRPRDWRLLEMALERGEASLPEIDRLPFFG